MVDHGQLEIALTFLKFPRQTGHVDQRNLTPGNLLPAIREVFVKDLPNPFLGDAKYEHWHDLFPILPEQAKSTSRQWATTQAAVKFEASNV
jgi:hypothetical protein